MDYLVLLGILIVIVGFALKLDAILIIFAAAIVTALVGGIGAPFVLAFGANPVVVGVIRNQILPALVMISVQIVYMLIAS